MTIRKILFNFKTIFMISMLVVASVFSIGGCGENNNSDVRGFVKICEADPMAEICIQKYALCIAASCSPETIDGSKIECGHCDTDDGSCGYCYVFEGVSCSFNAPCSEIQPDGDTVFSTYSDELSINFGFLAQECSQIQPMQANCMDAQCTLTGESAPLTDNFGNTSMIPTAICDCELINSTQPSGTLGGQCNVGNCSAIWSTSSEFRGSPIDIVPQCIEGN